MSKGLVASTFGVLAIALIAAGCGSGSSTSTTASVALSKAEFLKQGNQICAEGNKKINAEVEEFIKENNLRHNQEPTQAQKEELAETVFLPNVTEQVEGVNSLGPPDSEAAAVIVAAEEAIEKGEEDPASLVTDSGGPFTKANKLAREYGLTACAGE